MRLQFTERVCVVSGILLMLLHGPCLAMDVNEFYEELVKVVKSGDGEGLERLAKDNKATAQECLRVLKQRLERETNPDRAAGFTIVEQELREVLAILSGTRDCEAAANLVQQGEQSAIPEVKMAKFTRALRLCSSNVDAYVGLGDLNKRLGRFIPAVQSYEAALGLWKDDSRAFLGLGETLYGAGLYRRSLPFFQRLLELDPADRRAREYHKIVTDRIGSDADRIIGSEELVDLLWGDGDSNLMCMCPYFAKLNARVRLRKVTFAVESVKLSAQARRQLKELAAALITPALKDGYYLIEGHADSIGQAGYNGWISVKRARAVKHYLVKRCGVPASQVGVAGMGESRPWTTNQTSRGRRSNRRIEILSIERSEKEAMLNTQPSRK